MELIEILEELAADENWDAYLTISGVAFLGAAANEVQQQEVQWYDEEGLYLGSGGVEFCP